MTTNDIKYWLEEKDLKTPEHDKMVLWTFENCDKILSEFELIPKNNENIVEYLSFFPSIYGDSVTEYGNWSWDKKQFIIDSKLTDNAKSRAEEIKKNIEADYLGFIEIRKNNRINIDKYIEYPLQDRYASGFIDLFINLGYIRFYNHYFTERFYSKWEHLDWRNRDIENKNKFYFEIKPNIKSIGEVLRQINYYRKYLKGYFILVTKTKGLKEIFKSQGIHVYEYSPTTEKLSNSENDHEKNMQEMPSLEA